MFSEREPPVEGPDVLEGHPARFVPGKALLVHVRAPLQEMDLLRHLGGCALADLDDLLNEPGVQLDAEDAAVDGLD